MFFITLTKPETSFFYAATLPRVLCVVDISVHCCKTVSDLLLTLKISAQGTLTDDVNFSTHLNSVAKLQRATPIPSWPVGCSLHHRLFRKCPKVTDWLALNFIYWIKDVIVSCGLQYYMYRKKMLNRGLWNNAQYFCHWPLALIFLTYKLSKLSMFTQPWFLDISKVKGAPNMTGWGSVLAPG